MQLKTKFYHEDTKNAKRHKDKSIEKVKSKQKLNF